MPPRRRGPVKVSQLSSQSPHAICKANQSPVDIRPLRAMRRKRKEKGLVSESDAPLNSHSRAVNSVFMPDVFGVVKTIMSCINNNCYKTVAVDGIRVRNVYVGGCLM
jgi:hypothetical protein